MREDLILKLTFPLYVVALLVYPLPPVVRHQVFTSPEEHTRGAVYARARQSQTQVHNPA